MWAGIDEEASYLAAWVGLAELALGGCTSTADHLYIAPRAGGDLWSAEIAAAREVGLRFHPTRGSMTVSEKDGGLPPDSVVQDDDAVLADSERLVAAFHDPSPASMLRVALAPCSPFSVSPALMTATAELAERLDVRLHTHLAEDPDEDEYCLERFGRRPVDQFEEVGWLTSAGLGGALHLSRRARDHPARGGRRRRRALPELEHDPGQRPDLRRSRDLRAAGAPGRARLRRLVVERHRVAVAGGPHRAAARQDARRARPAATARDALDLATRGGAACLGRTGEIGELTVGACGDLVVWAADPIAHAGALTDPVEAWLRCGPGRARETVVAGRVLVEGGALTLTGVDDVLARHRDRGRPAAGRAGRLTVAPVRSNRWVVPGPGGVVVTEL